MSIPRISIVIPAYNESRNIAAALNSCLEQDVHHFEIIIGIEEYDQKSIEIIQTFINKDSRISLDLYKRRKSVCAKINSMIALCRGEIVVKMDADMRWAHRRCFRLLLEYFQDEKVGGVSIAGDRGWQGYDESFQLVTDEKYRRLIMDERRKSWVAFIESAFTRMVGKFRETLFPIYGDVEYPIDIHTFRKNLFDPLNENYIHDDAQFAYSVLKKGKQIIYGKEIVIVHLGVPDSLHAFYKQKSKGLAGWHVFEKNNNINIRLYYMELLKFIYKNRFKILFKDKIAILLWIILYAFVLLSFRLVGPANKSRLWASPGRS